MGPYPRALRTRVVAAVEQGDMTSGEVAEVFSGGRTFVKKLLRLQRAGEDLAPRQGGGSAPKLTDPDRALLGEAVAPQAEVTLAEGQAVLAAQGGGRVSVPPFVAPCNSSSSPEKKSLGASERAEKARREVPQTPGGARWEPGRRY